MVASKRFTLRKCAHGSPRAARALGASWQQAALALERAQGTAVLVASLTTPALQQGKRDRKRIAPALSRVSA